MVDRYDRSDDWIPIYDRTDLDGFYVAIGTSGNQFKNAGVAGFMMAELIEAVAKARAHDGPAVLDIMIDPGVLSPGMILSETTSSLKAE